MAHLDFWKEAELNKQALSVLCLAYNLVCGSQPMGTGLSTRMVNAQLGFWRCVLHVGTDHMHVHVCVHLCALVHRDKCTYASTGVPVGKCSHVGPCAICVYVFRDGHMSLVNP